MVDDPQLKAAQQKLVEDAAQLTSLIADKAIINSFIRSVKGKQIGNQQQKKSLLEALRALRSLQLPTGQIVARSFQLAEIDEKEIADALEKEEEEREEAERIAEEKEEEERKKLAEETKKDLLERISLITNTIIPVDEALEKSKYREVRKDITNFMETDFEKSIGDALPFLVKQLNKTETGDELSLRDLILKEYEENQEFAPEMTEDTPLDIREKFNELVEKLKKTVLNFGEYKIAKEALIKKIIVDLQEELSVITSEADYKDKEETQKKIEDLISKFIKNHLEITKVQTILSDETQTLVTEFEKDLLRTLYDLYDHKLTNILNSLNDGMRKNKFKKIKRRFKKLSAGIKKFTEEVSDVDEPPETTSDLIKAIKAKLTLVEQTLSTKKGDNASELEKISKEFRKTHKKLEETEEEINTLSENKGIAKLYKKVFDNSVSVIKLKEQIVAFKAPNTDAELKTAIDIVDTNLDLDKKKFEKAVLTLEKKVTIILEKKIKEQETDRQQIQSGNSDTAKQNAEKRVTQAKKQFEKINDLKKKLDVEIANTDNSSQIKDLAKFLNDDPNLAKHADNENTIIVTANEIIKEATQAKNDEDDGLDTTVLLLKKVQELQTTVTQTNSEIDALDDNEGIAKLYGNIYGELRELDQYSRKYIDFHNANAQDNFPTDMQNINQLLSAIEPFIDNTIKKLDEKKVEVLTQVMAKIGTRKVPLGTVKKVAKKEKEKAKKAAKKAEKEAKKESDEREKKRLEVEAERERRLAAEEEEVIEAVESEEKAEKDSEATDPKNVDEIINRLQNKIRIITTSVTESEKNLQKIEYSDDALIKEFEKETPDTEGLILKVKPISEAVLSNQKILLKIKGQIDAIVKINYQRDKRIINRYQRKISNHIDSDIKKNVDVHFKEIDEKFVLIKRSEDFLKKNFGNKMIKGYKNDFNMKILTFLRELPKTSIADRKHKQREMLEPIEKEANKFKEEHRKYLNLVRAIIEPYQHIITQMEAIKSIENSPMPPTQPQPAKQPPALPKQPPPIPQQNTVPPVTNTRGSNTSASPLDKPSTQPQENKGQTITDLTSGITGRTPNSMFWKRVEENKTFMVFPNDYEVSIFALKDNEDSKLFAKRLSEEMRANPNKYDVHPVTHTTNGTDWTFQPEDRSITLTSPNGDSRSFYVPPQKTPEEFAKEKS